MNETMTTESIAREITEQETAELCVAIDQALAKMDELREKMRRDDAVIEESSRATWAILADVNKLLTELRAA